MVIYKSRSVRLKKKKPLVLKIEGYGKNCGPFRESITREARPSLGVLTQIRERNVSKTFYASVVDDTAASYWEVWGCKSILFRCELCPTESGPVEYHPACATVGSTLCHGKAVHAGDAKGGCPLGRPQPHEKWASVGYVWAMAKELIKRNSGSYSSSTCDFSVTPLGASYQRCK